MVITLREESLEKAVALNYWLIVNALAYAYDKPNPEQVIIGFLEGELQALDPRIVEVPNTTIESLIVKQERVEVIVAFKHSWGIHRVHVLIGVNILDKSSQYDPKRNELIVKTKLQVLSDKPIMVGLQGFRRRAF